MSGTQEKDTDRKKTSVNIWLNRKEMGFLEQIKDYFSESSSSAALRKAIGLTSYIVDQAEKKRLVLTSDPNGEKVREIVLL